MAQLKCPGFVKHPRTQASCCPDLEYSMRDSSTSKGEQTMAENTSEKYIKEGARKVTARDFVKVIGKSREIQNRFRMRGPLNRFVEDARLLLAFVKDYWSGRYRKVPYGIIAAVVF